MSEKYSPLQDNEQALTAETLLVLPGLRLEHDTFQDLYTVNVDPKAVRNHWDENGHIESESPVYSAISSYRLYHGFSFTRESFLSIETTDDPYNQRSAVVRFPGVDRLNTEREQFVETGLVHNGTFAEFQGGLMTNKEFTQYIADGKIPIATDPSYRLHDTLVHAEGYALLAPQVFELLQSTAQHALENDDPVGAGILVDLCEYFSVKPDNLSEIRYVKSDLMKHPEKVQWDAAGLKPINADMSRITKAIRLKGNLKRLDSIQQEAVLALHKEFKNKK